MCDPKMLSIMSIGTQVAGTAISAKGAYDSAKADRAAYNYQAQVAANNAQIAEWQAQDALTRGKLEEVKLKMEANQLKGAQRARLAANGVALDEGTPLHLLAGTDVMAAKDIATIRDNAAREAWGYRVDATNATNESRLLRSRSKSGTSPLLAAGTALLGGAGQVAQSWYRYKQVGLA